MENKNRYCFNYSQDVIDLQTKYALFKRVANIVFSVSFDGGFKPEVMHKAIDLLIERNDCLRLRFVKEKGKTLQEFDEHRSIGDIPAKAFKTNAAQKAFVNRFRKKVVNLYKGKSIEAVFVTGVDGTQSILFKVSHMVADSYGIGVLVADLKAVYDALASGAELPPAPGKFEAVLQKDTEYRADTAALERDREFFQEYFSKRHPDTPMYCGVNGDENDRWLAQKRKGKFSLPYLFVRCDTEGYRFVIPSSITEKVVDWCTKNGITLNTFFFYTYAIGTSLKNGKAPYQVPLELMNCRATVVDRKAAGTKVQSLAVYTTVDYGKSFAENVKALFDEQSELYRHTRLSYLENESYQHKLWNYSLAGQVTSFCFSYIPMAFPKGVQVQLQSNGKGALVVYLALMHDVQTNEIQVVYDVQTHSVTPGQLIDFQSLWIQIIEQVLKSPDTPLGDIF